MEGVGVPIGAAGREVGIVVGTAHHEGWRIDAAEVHVEKRETFSAIGGQVSATPTGRGE